MLGDGRYPKYCFGQWLGREGIAPFAPLLLHGHQVGLLQNLQMLGDALPRNGQLFGKFRTLREMSQVPELNRLFLSKMTERMIGMNMIDISMLSTF